MTDDIATLSYERALAELDELITRLERGSVDLDEAITCYERGARLAQRCAELLDRTEARVMQLVVGVGGVQQERPLAVEDAMAADEPAGEPSAAGVTARRADAGPARPVAPPPPGSPVRARAVARDEEPPALFPGLDPARFGDPPEVDLDDIPF